VRSVPEALDVELLTRMNAAAPILIGYDGSDTARRAVREGEVCSSSRGRYGPERITTGGAALDEKQRVRFARAA
jgi:hypothetical protein